MWVPILATLVYLVKYRLLAISLLLSGCGQGVVAIPDAPGAVSADITDDVSETEADIGEGAGLFVDVLEPIAFPVEAADPSLMPGSKPAWIVSTFGFLYAEEDLSVDALDIDDLASTLAEEPASDACAHEDFVTPDGGLGVDHQLLRLLETFESLQENGLADTVLGISAKDGSLNILLTADEDEVQVVMGHDPPMTGNDGAVLPGSSFRPHPDPAYTASLGVPTVTDGVYVAGPADVELLLTSPPVAAPEGTHYVFSLRAASVRLEVLEDGTAHGLIQGYWPLDAIVEIFAGSPVHLSGLGYTLPEFMGVLNANADGNPDEEGVCRDISSAFYFSAEPAFLIDQEVTP